MDYNLSIPVNLQTVSTCKYYLSFSGLVDLEFNDDLFHTISEENNLSLCTDSYYTCDIPLNIQSRDANNYSTLKSKSSYNNMFSIQRKHHNFMINN